MRSGVQFDDLGTARFVFGLEGFLVEEAAHVEVGHGEQVQHAVVVLGAPLVEEGGEVKHLSRFDFITNS